MEVEFVIIDFEVISDFFRIKFRKKEFKGSDLCCWFDFFLKYNLVIRKVENYVWYEVGNKY